MKESEGAKITLSGNYGAAGIDVELEDGMVLAFGNCSITAHSTPGHTDGCFTFVTNEQTMAFTGDCLLIRGAGRTDFQSGDVHTLWGSIREKIFSLPDECLLYPGHDYMGRTVSTVTEEKKFNPRIGGDAREEDFAGYMNNLGLPHPKQLDIALPANLRAGKPDALMSKPTWAPINVTFAGIPEVEPDWVARHLDEICVLDVRSEAEYSGDLGYIEGSILIPLDQLRDRIREVPTDKPVVAMCQSGKRSSMATQILKASGIEDVANVPGGLIHWSRLALPLHYRIGNDLMNDLMNDPMNDLEGITVVALEQAVAAPYVSGRLAEAGARVIKIERAEGRLCSALRPACARPERLLRLAECRQRKCDAKPERFE